MDRCLEAGGARSSLTGWLSSKVVCPVRSGKRPCVPGGLLRCTRHFLAEDDARCELLVCASSAKVKGRLRVRKGQGGGKDD